MYVGVDGHQMSSVQTPELNKGRTFCRKLEKIFLKSAIDLGFKSQGEQRIKLKPDAKLFRRADGNMISDKKKAKKKSFGRTH